MCGNRPRQAFTLIELLVVVAIIAILAAIAVPNLLEAQTRSKVSRVKADLRTLATALEAYTVDNNRPPHDGSHGAPHRGWVNTYTDLTTPIAYMTTILTDPFQDPTFSDTTHPVYTHFLDGKLARKNHAYDYGSAEWHGLYVGDPGAIGYFRNFRTSPWKIGSAGPDRRFSDETSNYGMKDLYDPTNGTVSGGDIYRSRMGQH
jgi:type II secretion system protein G